MTYAQACFAVEATAAAVHAARRLITAAVKSWGTPLDGELLFRVETVASELLTNGLLHAGSPMTVEVTLRDELLAVAVLDGSPVLPQPRAAGIDDERGRGLTLIDALCLFHGTERTAVGKRCWAVLPVAVPSDPAAEEAPDGTRERGAPGGDERWSVTPAGRRLLASLFPAGGRQPGPQKDKAVASYE